MSRRPGARATGGPLIGVVTASYFVASFAALGLPPYLTEILPGFGPGAVAWAGVLYVLPTACSGLAAPVWGRLADRYGRKRLLLRAQLGLTAAFLLAGWANSVGAFAVALALQGILGGTYAASTSYLAATVPGPSLSRALTMVQGAARAALVAAPIVVGTLSTWITPHRQYSVLAALPLAAALLLTLLPESRYGEPPVASPPSGPSDVPTSSTDAVTPPESATPPGRAHISVRGLYAFEMAFVFSTVVSFPYLVALVQHRLPGASPVLSGALFALPHLCYLLAALAVHAPCHRHPRQALGAGLLTVAIALAAHGIARGLVALVLARLLLGAGLTLGLVALAVLTADTAHGRAAGAHFGSLELASKAGAVLAGLASALSAAWAGPSAPIVLGALAAALATPFALSPRSPRGIRRRDRLWRPQPHPQRRPRPRSRSGQSRRASPHVPHEDRPSSLPLPPAARTTRSEWSH